MEGNPLKGKMNNEEEQRVEEGRNEQSQNDCQDQAQDLGDRFFNTVAGLFYGEDRSSDSFLAASSPEKDPLSLAPAKPKRRHERNVSWGVLPSTQHTPPFPENQPNTPRTHNRTDSTLLGDVPSVIAIDQTTESQASSLPPLKPALTHKRTLTSTHVFPTEIFPPIANANPPSPRRKHKRSMTHAIFPATEFPPPPSVTSHLTMEPDNSSLQPNPVPAARPKPAVINLQDVVMTAPFELEAETHILRALEEQVEDTNAVQKATSEPEAHTILPHVPDTMAHDFSLPPPAEAAGEETVVATDEQGFECLDVQQSAQANSQAAQAAQAKKETKPLLSPNNTKKKMHRPTKSVEQTLFGLTAALSAMDDAHQRSNKGDDASSCGDESNVSDTSGLPAADKVAKTAHTLANRLKKEQSIRHLHVEPMLPEDRPANDWGDSVRFDVSLNGEGSGTVSSGNQSKIDVESQTSDETAEGPRDDDQNNKPAVDEVKKKERMKRRRSRFSFASTKLKDDWDLFSEVLSPRKASIYVRNVLLFLILPATGIAALLFYSLGNPHAGYSAEGENTTASISWWLLFLCVRQAVTLTLALATQTIVIDFLATGSWIFLRFFGPILTLFLAQAKGWPFVLVFWGLYNLALLSGSGQFANHWGYAQDWITLFNETNPSGDVTNSDVYFQVIYIAIGVGVAVSLKRLAIGMFLGRQTFAHYGQDLAAVMNKMVLVSEVASLANEIYRSRDAFVPQFAESTASWDFGMNPEVLQKMISPTKLEREESTAEQKQQPTFQEPGNSSGLMDLLERWEEPDRARHDRKRGITISAVLQFRRALSYMQRKYPFSNAFGPCDTREECIESAQAVYDKLLLRTPGKETLNFETIALVAKNLDGFVDENKVMALIKVFRPARDGQLTKLEFVKSCDNVYKALRLLTATVANSWQIDQAFENILNILFYIILGCMILSFLGFDPLALFISFSSVFLAFAFVFSSASAKYFEGMIFILVQRPYGVGDRIHVSRPDDETNPDGSSGWIVEKVTLFSTAVYWTATNEYATLSNAAIANSRIINAARSPHAKLQVTMKFGINVPYERIVIFKSAVEQYMKARPREWLQLVGFRASNVTVDRGFQEYNIIGLHRESWQSIGSILESRATLTSYCLEVTKQLDMRFMSPPLPVSLKIANPTEQGGDRGPEDGDRGQEDGDRGQEEAGPGNENTRSMPARTDFRLMALSHGIKLDRQ